MGRRVPSAVVVHSHGLSTSDVRLFREVRRGCRRGRKWPPPLAGTVCSRGRSHRGPRSGASPSPIPACSPAIGVARSLLTSASLPSSAQLAGVWARATGGSSVQYFTKVNGRLSAFTTMPPPQRRTFGRRSATAGAGVHWFRYFGAPLATFRVPGDRNLAKPSSRRRHEALNSVRRAVRRPCAGCCPAVAELAVFVYRRFVVVRARLGSLRPRTATPGFSSTAVGISRGGSPA